MKSQVSKKQAKKVAKNAARRAAKNKQVEAEDAIPINEQSVDLPVADGTVEGAQLALDTTRDLTKALRAKRRAAIKEANFLRTMR
jgi:large subunit ribosomal protein L54